MLQPLVFIFVLEIIQIICQRGNHEQIRAVAEFDFISGFGVNILLNAVNHCGNLVVAAFLFEEPY